MLQVGSAAPDVTLLNERSEAFALSALFDRPLVLYFYPKDETPGCTAEACAFRDAYESFTQAGARVLGVSSDSAQTHARFRSRHTLPFDLASDPKGAAAAAFGVPKTFGVLPGRVTFVIDTSGVIRYAFNSQFRAARHVEEALRALQSLG